MAIPEWARAGWVEKSRARGGGGGGGGGGGMNGQMMKCGRASRSGPASAPT